jgi:hypothetical protein
VPEVTQASATRAREKQTCLKGSQANQDRAQGGKKRQNQAVKNWAERSLTQNNLDWGDQAAKNQAQENLGRQQAAEDSTEKDPTIVCTANTQALCSRHMRGGAAKTNDAGETGRWNGKDS